MTAVSSVKNLGNLELPVFVKELLLYGQKHSVEDKFVEMIFLAIIDKPVKKLRGVK